MIKGMMKSALNGAVLLAVAAGLTVGAVSAPAEAAVVDVFGNVNAVEYSEGTLLIQLNDGVNYFAMTAAPSACSGFSKKIDTLKAWQSMSQAALLSGKRLRVYFDTCGGTKYIQVLDIWN